MSLEGKIAVVTGGANGIGQAFSERLASQGANVAVADIADCSETKAKVEAAGGRFFSSECDVAEPAAVTDFAEQVRKKLGDPTILINNVGIFPLQPFEEITWEDWRRIQGINVDSQFLFTKAFLSGMKAAGWGRIVNLSSTVNWLMIPTYVHYITTKAATIGSPEVSPTKLEITASQ